MNISALEQQIQKLIHLHQQSLEKQKQLIEKNKALVEETEYQKKLIAELKEKNQAVRVAQSMSTETGKAELRQKIDAYIKEVDRCLELLKNEPL